MSSAPFSRHPVQIKICGLTRADDAVAAIECGTAMLGLNFHPPSPRFVSVEQARQIARAVEGHAPLVGIFVNIDLLTLRQIIREVPLDAVQLCGTLPFTDTSELGASGRLIRALPADSVIDEKQLAGFHALLIDTPTPQHGGSGETFTWNSVNWPALRAALPQTQLFLAGGLNAANVGAAIAAAHPDVVDVCSGVEQTKGIKSLHKMREFAAAVRAAEGQPQ